MKKKSSPELVFPELKSELEPTQIQSMCVRCGQNGTTTLLLTVIPLFREIIISSFQCHSCGQKNTQVQFGGKLPDFGVQIMLKCLHKDDFNRQVIKSQHSVITFTQIQLQIPSNKRSEITTIESILLRTMEDLSHDQQMRMKQKPEDYQKIEQFIDKIKSYLNGTLSPLTFKIRDPSGNSNIKNPYAPKLDKNMQITNFHRSADELKAMGYSTENAEEQNKVSSTTGNKLNFTKPFDEQNFMRHEPVIFEVPCESCLMPGEVRMCETSVPYFTDLVIMSFSCNYCGAHTAETKSSGEIKDEGLVIILKVEGQKDLKRDLFKSETCAVNLPEIQLQLDYGTLGGVFTTVEGLLQKIQDHLCSNNPFVDSDNQFGARMKELLLQIGEMRSGDKKFTLILTDPLAQSFLQNPYLPEEDKNAKRQLRKRTFEEDEMLGLNDMKVENYQ